SYDTRHPGPSDFGILIEVADSSLLTDRRDKGRIYARESIPVYWIVNLVDRQVEVYTDPDPAASPPAYRTRTDYRPGDAVPITFRGLFVNSRMSRTPRSCRICAPIPKCRRSGANPSRRFASTVSSPSSCCSLYARSLFNSPIPRPSCRMYAITPRPASATCRIAYSSCGPQSHLAEWSTSPVRHSLLIRSCTGSACAG